VKHRIKLVYGVLAGALLIVSVGKAAEPRPPEAFSSQPATPARQWVRDPFTPSALMYETAGAQSGMLSGAYGFVPTGEGMHIPKMKLLGLLNQEKDDYIALLDVAGVGTFMVREGDEFNIDPSKPKNAVRISKITRLSVTVETGMLGTIKVLR
jgi:hypothetical protein